MKGKTKRAPAMERALASPVGRALLAKQWAVELQQAGLHAYMGGDSVALCQHAGCVFFVVLGAAQALAMAPDHPDLSIVRGAVNAVYEQRGVAEISEQHRAAVISGVHAAERLAAGMQQRVLAETYLDLCLKLAESHVTSDDFLRLMGRDGAAPRAAGE